jgi:hypothetical protein
MPPGQMQALASRCSTSAPLISTPANIHPSTSQRYVEGCPYVYHTLMKGRSFHHDPWIIAQRADRSAKTLQERRFLAHAILEPRILDHNWNTPDHPKRRSVLLAKLQVHKYHDMICFLQDAHRYG